MGNNFYCKQRAAYEVRISLVGSEMCIRESLNTAPQYRRQGVATRILTRLVEDAHRRGVTAISLEATAMGRPLYEKFGFVPMEHEMELPE